jgi:23S rRNA A1618 N6-methylase RlmF
VHITEVNIRDWCGLSFKDVGERYPPFGQYLDEKGRIDLGDTEALSAYNIGLANIVAGIDIKVPSGYLVPTFCLRYSYIKYVHDILLPNNPHLQILEIGIGASSIMSMMAAKLFRITMVATEINDTSFEYAANNIRENNLDSRITLLKSIGGILDGVVDPNKNYDVLITYPPVYPEKDRSTYRDKYDRDLDMRGYGGSTSEMIGGGSDGFDFVNQLIAEAVSNKFRSSIKYLTILLISKDHAVRSQKLLSEFGYQSSIVTFYAGTRSRFLLICQLHA